mmetsp:Transcript_102406/g.271004  ORF Transcript_102406/g.271004 Transcript_102406/m.271004 type:complete len:225 (+) Transcript_102406:717-1391(+)
MARKGFQDRAVNKLRTRSRGVVPRDPRVFESLFSSHALLGIHHQQALNKIPSRIGQSIPTLGSVNPNHATPDPRPDLRLGALGAEGQLDHEEPEDDDAKAPHVARASGIVFAQDLWRNVHDAPQRLFHGLALFQELGEAKIDELQEVPNALCDLLVIHEVFELQIPVYHALTVQVVHRPQHMQHRPRGLRFREAPHLFRTLEELAALQCLHHEADLLIGLVDVH